jgi:uncharacterized protein
MRDTILGFVLRLRTAGVRISVAESLDAADGVVAAGLERIRMREALAATLIKDEADRPVFDREFDLYFRASRVARGEARRGQSWQGMAGQHGHPSESAGAQPLQRKPATARQGAKTAKPPEQSEATEPAAKPSQREGDAGTGPRPEPGDGQLTTAASAALNREVETRPFTTYTDLDYERALNALAPLRRRFRVRVGRRLRLARRGRVDIRRTIRAGLQHGGALIDLRMRRRRPRHIDLLLLADISGSVRYASSLMLGLAAGARDCFRTVHSFVYVDHLAEAGFEQGYLNMVPMLDLYARSDFGRVLAELLATRRHLLNRATLVVILGDGRNNRRPPRADLMRQLRLLCRAVVWLNPEEPARWGTGDSAIPVYAREVDEMVACRNLRELEKSLIKVA